MTEQHCYPIENSEIDLLKRVLAQRLGYLFKVTGSDLSFTMSDDDFMQDSDQEQ